MQPSSRFWRSCQWLGLGIFSLLLSSCAPTPDKLEDLQPAPIVTSRGIQVAPPDSFSLSTPAKPREEAPTPVDNYVSSPYRDRGLGVKPNRPPQAEQAQVDDSDKYELKPSRDSDQQGMASWYGEQFHGKKTANGERFDSMGLTAAHRHLPFGSRVCVRSKVTGKTVVVRINDRGPFAAGRVIDLSKGAAMELGMVGLGIKPIELWKLDKNEDECPVNMISGGRKHHASASSPARKSHVSAPAAKRKSTASKARR